MAFSIRQLIPVPLKRAIKKLLGLEKAAPAKPSGGASAASRNSGGPRKPKAAPASSGKPKAAGGKRKGPAKRRRTPSPR